MITVVTWAFDNRQSATDGTDIHGVKEALYQLS